MSGAFKIAPSILAADFTRLGEQVREAEAGGADLIHCDVMDGTFVPNISFGPEVARVVRPLTRMKLDVHLMCSKPEILLEAFAKAGVDRVTVHVELGDKVTPLLWKIRSLGLKVGLAVNPPTGISHAQPYLDEIDLLLVMTVIPGFGGQPFIHEMLPKIQQAAAWRRERDLAYRIEVDGGITLETAVECASAGADTFVSGTALFKQRQMGRAVQAMRQAVLKCAAGGETCGVGR